jgi:hypothetical protein
VAPHVPAEPPVAPSTADADRIGRLERDVADVRRRLQDLSLRLRYRPSADDDVYPAFSPVVPSPGLVDLNGRGSSGRGDGTDGRRLAEDGGPAESPDVPPLDREVAMSSRAARALFGY